MPFHHSFSTTYLPRTTRGLPTRPNSTANISVPSRDWMRRLIEREGPTKRDGEAQTIIQVEVSLLWRDLCLLIELLNLAFSILA